MIILTHKYISSLGKTKVTFLSYVLGTMLSPLWTLYFILHIPSTIYEVGDVLILILQMRTGAYKEVKNCPRSHNSQVAVPGLNPRLTLNLCLQSLQIF